MKLSYFCLSELIKKTQFAITDPVAGVSFSPANHRGDTSGWLVLVRFLEEFEDTKKTFQN